MHVLFLTGCIVLTLCVIFLVCFIVLKFMFLISGYMCLPFSLSFSFPIFWKYFWFFEIFGLMEWLLLNIGVRITELLYYFCSLIHWSIYTFFVFSYIYLLIRNWMVPLDCNSPLGYCLGLLLTWGLYPIIYTSCCLDMRPYWLKYVDCILFLWFLYFCVHVPFCPPSTEFITLPWSSECLALKICSIYLVLWCLDLITVYLLGKLELDSIMLVQLFGVYTLHIFPPFDRIMSLYETHFNWFFSPWVEVDHFQIIGIITSWTVLLGLSGWIWMLLNELGWILHLWWIG